MADTAVTLSPRLPVPVSATDRCVADVFAQVAARHADRVAVQCGGVALGYAALAARVQALAGALLAVAPEPGRPVALLLDDPVHQVVAMMAVLRAGHFFVTLAVTDPAPRLADTIARGEPAASSKP